MAQVMKYYEYPSYFNWSSMHNHQGGNEVSQLMYVIGVSVFMDYWCDGSGANTQNTVSNSFKNVFDYTSASYDNYLLGTVINNLNQNKPVILRGERKSSWFIFSVYTDGHAWVADGYRRYKICHYNESGDAYAYNNITYLRMNWGWDGYLNGWFRADNWNPGNNTFNYQRGMVYNITP